MPSAHCIRRRVTCCLIGLATGSWAQVIANHPQVESLTVVEINPGYLRLVAKYPQVASLLSNPKVRIVIDDGRRWLTRHDRRFDMIVSNTPFHWRAHSTNLLSVEYCRLVRAHLRPGGVYYFNTTGSTAALKTAMVEFPYGVRVMSLAAVSLSPVAFDRHEVGSGPGELPDRWPPGSEPCPASRARADAAGDEFVGDREPGQHTPPAGNHSASHGRQYVAGVAPGGVRVNPQWTPLPPSGLR